MPSRHPDDLHRRLVIARTHSARMQGTPPTAAAPNRENQDTPSNYEWAPRPEPGRPLRNPHNMQLTQPSTSVPSKAICRMRM
jgi:hypothetical protein